MIADTSEITYVLKPGVKYKFAEVVCMGCKEQAYILWPVHSPLHTRYCDDCQGAFYTPLGKVHDV